MLLFIGSWPGSWERQVRALQLPPIDPPLNILLLTCLGKDIKVWSTSKKKQLHELQLPQLLQLLHVCIGTTRALSFEDWHSKCLKCAGTICVPLQQLNTTNAFLQIKFISWSRSAYFSFRCNSASHATCHSATAFFLLPLRKRDDFGPPAWCIASGAHPMEPPSPCIKELLHKYKPTRALRSASENNLVIPKTRLSRELTQTAGSKTRITKKMWCQTVHSQSYATSCRKSC